MPCPDEIAIARWLDRDPAAADDEIQAHIDRCAACGDLVAALGRVATAGDPSASLARQPTEPATPAGQPATGGELAAGDHIGRFSVLEVVGSGGMGIVYAAHDPQLDRKVAIKLLRPDAGWQVHGARRRLLREAQALARITHPNVIAVHDVGTVGEDVFVAMEFIDGLSLRDWLATPRTWREKVDVFRQAALGLGAAHAAGLVHRDFKPGNALIGRDGRLRVLDFGLARTDERQREWHTPPELELPSSPLDSSPSPSPSPPLTTITRTGSVVGTPAYMSPEQIRARPIDARSDQFSFCVALYEALYGERPFPGDSLRELAIAIQRGNIRPERGDVGVPRWLRKVVLRGLAADPAARFASMQALAAALRADVQSRRRWITPVAVAVGVAVVACGGWALHRQQLEAVMTASAERTERRCAREGREIESAWNPRRRQALAAVLAQGKGYAESSMTALDKVLGDRARQWTDHRIAVCRAAASGDMSPALVERSTACFAERQREVAVLVDKVLAAPGMASVHDVVAAAHSLAPVDRCTDRRNLLAAVDPPSPALRDAVQLVRAELTELNLLNRLGQDRGVLERADAAVRTAQHLGYLPLVADALYRQGYLLERADQTERAEASFYQAIWTAEAAHNDSAAATAWLELLSLVGTTRAQPAEAEKLERHAQAAVERLGSPIDLKAALLDYMGSWRYHGGKFEEAEKLHRQAIEVMQSSPSPDELKLSIYENNLALPLRDRGKLTEAIELLRHSLELKEKHLGIDNPRIAISLSNLATTIAMTGDHSAALPLQRRSLAIRLAAYGAFHRSTCIEQINIGFTLAETAATRDEALAMFRDGAACAEKSLGADHPYSAHALVGIGSTLLDLGRAGEAIEPLERALAIRTGRAANTPPEQLGDARYHLGLALWRAGGSKARARGLVREAIRDYTAAGATAAATLAEAKAWLARPR